MTQKQKSIVGGVSILGVAGIICKVVGVLYRIPLLNIITDYGTGIYSIVFPTYNLLLAVSSAGLPVAISRMMAHHITREDPANARRIFHSALRILLILGVVTSVLMMALSGVLAEMHNRPTTRLGFIAIAPSLLCVCVMSAYRGYQQGLRNMVPTAVSQLIEQVGKVCIALPLAKIGTSRGVEYGAAGALLGITIVECLALLYMIFTYLRKRHAFDGLFQAEDAPIPSSRKIGTSLLRISIPITIGACIVPLASFIDSAMLVNRMMAAGLTIAEARPLYGLFSGLVIRLINIPTALALSISMSLVPAISAAAALNNTEGVRRQSNLGLRFAFLIGFPCSVGMSLLSRQLVSFFYAETLTAAEIQVTSELLSVSSLTVVLFTVVQATSAILQGLQKQRIPMYTLVAGVICKIALNYILVGTPGIHIHGGPIASLVCYTVSMLPNLYFVLKYSEMKPNWSGWLLRPGLATLCMGVAVYLLRAVLPLGRLWTILEVAVGVGVYLAAALAFKAITRDDFSSLRRSKRKKA